MKVDNYLCGLIFCKLNSGFPSFSLELGIEWIRKILGFCLIVYHDSAFNNFCESRAERIKGRRGSIIMFSLFLAHYTLLNTLFSLTVVSVTNFVDVVHS